MFDYGKWGKAIRYYRIKAEKTQEELAELANIDAKYLMRLEHGKAKPSLKLLVTICNILNIGVNDCFAEEFELNRVLYKQFKSELTTFDDSDRKFILSVIQHSKSLDLGDTNGI